MRTAKITLAAVALALAALAGCSSAPAASHAVAPASLAAAGHCAPGTPACSPNPSPPQTLPLPSYAGPSESGDAGPPPAAQHASLTLTGSGSYATAPLHPGCALDGNPITVKYKFSGNTTPGSGADLFSAELEDGTGAQVADANIVNEIAASGSGIANLYPDPAAQPPPYHLNVTDADQGAHWSFTLTCDKG